MSVLDKAVMNLKVVLRFAFKILDFVSS